jgi:lipase
MALDLRGHGASDRDPPWNTDTHVADVLETLDHHSVASAIVVGHSYGGLVSAALAAHESGRAKRLVLLDPAIEIATERALASAEMDRLDWSFASPEGATNALLSSPAVSDAPHETVLAYVRDELERGSDGQLRFRFCPSTAVVMWSEMTLPGPEIAQVPTLLVRPASSFINGRAQDRRYRDALGSLLSVTVVPKGHNVLWESPHETISAVEAFLDKD